MDINLRPKTKIMTDGVVVNPNVTVIYINGRNIRHAHQDNFIVTADTSLYVNIPLDSIA
jgi:hypothetical protein